MRISGIFNNNFLISSTGINAKQKPNKAKTHNNNIQLKFQNDEADVFIKKDSIKKLYDKNGNISLEAVYKDGMPYKDTWYDYNGKAHWVRYYDGSLNLSRNVWHDWKKAPKIDFEKTEDGKTTRMHAQPAVLAKGHNKGKIGGYNLSIRDNDGHHIHSDLYSYPDGTFGTQNDSYLPEMKVALTELLELISSEEYKDDFGSSYKFNNGIKNAIKYIESKE